MIEVVVSSNLILTNNNVHSTIHFLTAYKSYFCWCDVIYMVQDYSARLLLVYLFIKKLPIKTKTISAVLEYYYNCARRQQFGRRLRNALID